MSQAVETYLDRVMLYANIADAQRADTIRAEQADHLEEKIARLVEDGVPREDAVFQAIEQHGHPAVVGYGLRPKFSWIDVRTRGTARGVIAIGPKAVGVFAFGGCSVGVVACGGVAVGVVSFGGVALSLLFAFAGLGISLGLAWSGLAIATIAVGGGAIGAVAMGGAAAGLLAFGGSAYSMYTLDTAPYWLGQLASYLPKNPADWQWLLWTVLPLYFILLAIILIVQQRERRRTREAEPWMA